MKPVRLMVVAALLSAAPVGGRPVLERAVIVMRHGVRPPTKANVLPAGYTAERWPDWPVGFGQLTPRGAEGARLLGQADRRRWGRLLASKCPTAMAVHVEASDAPRAQDTARAWAGGFLPGCPVTVIHPAQGQTDTIFHGLDDKPSAFDGQRAWREAIALAPPGGIDAEDRAYAPALGELSRVLRCAEGCPIGREPSTLIAEPHDRPELSGPLDIGSTAGQVFLLEYLDGKPMSEVGWGRIDRDGIERLLAFHPLKFKYSNRPPYVARFAAQPLAEQIVAGLTAPGRRITLLAGHDTNLADLGGYYDLHWRVAGYPADDIPPGGALTFELWRDGKARSVRVGFRALTMDQQRNLENSAPFAQALKVLGCGGTCSLDRFVRLSSPR